MRIAYGIHGFGRGHAMRALAVLPGLTERHEVMVLAGGDAYRAVSGSYPTMRIPTFRYHYNKRGRLSNIQNIRRNVSAVLDLAWKGPSRDMVVEAMEEFRPDIVVTDSEALTHRVAGQLRIPRISFDHFGLLVYCRPEMSRLDRAICLGNALVYHALFGEPDRVIVSSFFDAAPTRSGVRVVGPVIREAVRGVRPTRGEHLLVYLSQGQHEYTPQIEQALMGLDCPVRVYGTGRQGRRGNVELRPAANQPFIDDLASCRAVFGTTGNQLLGEVVYFGKPMLGMPMACLEQRLNGVQLERRGIGLQVKRSQVTARRIQAFLSREEEFVKHASRTSRDGAKEALVAIEDFAEELAGSRACRKTR